MLGYCGIDRALRETAGNVALVEERIGDTAIHRRPKACLPRVKALLERPMGLEAGPLIHGHLRFVVVDGSTVQGPGASGIRYRPHMAVDWARLRPIQVEATDKRQGEPLGYYPLQEGDVVLMDRGYNQAQGPIAQAERGVGPVLRYNPHSPNVYDEAGEKIDLYERLRATAETTRRIPVRVREGGESIEGYVHACPRRKRPRPGVGSGPRRRKRAAASSSAPGCWPSGRRSSPR